MDQEPPRPGVSLRRSACDRCRGQKLRCLREGTNPGNRCDRCAKADTQCITSPIYRMRNHSVKYNNQIQPPQEGVSRKRLRSDRNSSDQLHLQNTSVQTPSTTAAVSNTPFDWPSEDSFTRQSYDESSDSHTLLNYQSLVDSLPTPLLPSTSASDNVINAWDNGDLALELNNTEIFPSATFDKHAGKTYTLPSSAPQPQPSQDTSCPPSYHEEISGRIPQEDLIFPDLGMRNADDTDDTSKYMEELSKINGDLILQLKRIARGSPYVNFKTIVSPGCGGSDPSSEITLLEYILNRTRHYLDILSLISKSSRSLPTSTLSASKVPANCGGYADTSEITPISDDDNSTQSSGSSPASRHADDISIPSALPDTSLILLLLLCYIHILRLHVAMFSHIQQYLEAVSESDESTIKTLPSLYGFSNFPLQSGNLQATMIIQLVTNLFERIETLLGLPRELRIGTRNDDHDGLLKNTGFLEIAKVLIRKEDAGQPEYGKGGIETLRKEMKKSRRLLRDRIAP